MRKSQADTQRIVRQGEAQRAQLQASTQRALATDRATQAATDHAARQEVQYVLDRQTFVDPATGERIEASNQFNHQWLSSDGNTLLQTQDHAYDPNGSVYPVSQSWTELVPER